MAVIETSWYTNKINNSNSNQEQREQQREETLNSIPVLHVKDVCKSFDYKNNKNNGRSKIANYDHISRTQQQQLSSNSTSNLRTFTHDVLNGVDLRIREGEFVTIVGPSGCSLGYSLQLYLDAVIGSSFHKRWIEIELSARSSCGVLGRFRVSMC